MPKSEAVKSTDEILASLSPLLNLHGFSSRGRTFNRSTSDGLVQVIGFQLGQRSLSGKFTVNLGVFVPEVAMYCLPIDRGSFIKESYCCVRARLGSVGPERKDLWWPAVQNDQLVDELTERLTRDALPFLQRFLSRDAILDEWKLTVASEFAGNPSRIICAILLAGRGQHDEAKSLLTAQASETSNPGHAEYVCTLADRLGLGTLTVTQNVD